MGVAYFIRGRCESWAVIKLHPDNTEEVIADGLSFTDAENLCVANMEGIARGAAADPALPVEDIAPQRRRPRQLMLKF